MRNSSPVPRFPLGPAFLAPALLTIAAVPAVGDDGPFFRGPNNNGLSAESGWTTVWPVAGPTVAGSFVYTLGYLGQVHCLDIRDGRVVWLRHHVDEPAIRIVHLLDWHHVPREDRAADLQDARSIIENGQSERNRRRSCCVS